MYRSCLLVLMVFPVVVAGLLADPESRADKVRADGPETLALRGRVVWMNDALSRLHGVRTVPESAERILALETGRGDLHPLVEDVRGRAFRRDKRLRERDVELLVRRHPGSAMVQVIRLFSVQPDGKFELDYWCEICAIAMVELKACDCCQGPIELRKRRESRVKSREPEVK